MSMANLSFRLSPPRENRPPESSPYHPSFPGLPQHPPNTTARVLNDVFTPHPHSAPHPPETSHPVNYWNPPPTGMGAAGSSNFANSRVAQEAIKAMKPKFSGQATDWADFRDQWGVYWDMLTRSEPTSPHIEAIMFVDNLPERDKNVYLKRIQRGETSIQGIIREMNARYRVTLTPKYRDELMRLKAPNTLTEYTDYINDWKRLAPQTAMNPDELRRVMLKQHSYARAGEILAAEMEPNQGQDRFLEPQPDTDFMLEPFTQHKIYTAFGILEYTRRKLEVLERQRAHLSQYQPREPQWRGTPRPGGPHHSPQGSRYPHNPHSPNKFRNSPTRRYSEDEGDTEQLGEAEIRSNGDRPTFHGCWSCGRKGHRHGDCQDYNSKLPHKPPPVSKCWSCGKMGHRNGECPRPNPKLPHQPPRRNSQSPSGSDSSRTNSPRGRSPSRGKSDSHGRPRPRSRTPPPPSRSHRSVTPPPRRRRSETPPRRQRSKSPPTRKGRGTSPSSDRSRTKTGRSPSPRPHRKVEDPPSTSH